MICCYETVQIFGCEVTKKSTETLHQQQIPIIEQIRPLSYDDNLAELNCGEIASGLLEARNSHKYIFFQE